MESIKIWTEEGTSQGGVRHGLPTFAKVAVARSIEVAKETLHQGIRDFSAQFADLLDGKPLTGSMVMIDEVELSLTVTASGGIELLGKVEAGAQASIKVKLKRVAS